ncbi:MAG: hypothetical protein ACYDCN_14785 [Bacteroidia bacterium]
MGTLLNVPPPVVPPTVVPPPVVPPNFVGALSITVAWSTDAFPPIGFPASSRSGSPAQTSSGAPTVVLPATGVVGSTTSTPSSPSKSILTIGLLLAN